MSYQHVRQANSLAMWWLWTKHYERSTAIENPNGLHRLRTKQAIRRNWNAIARVHPEDHAQLKRDLCDAIDRANISEIQSNAALAAAQASLLPNLPSTARQRTVAHELALREKIQSLRDLTALVVIESRIGAPVAAVRDFDAGDRIDQLRRQVDSAATLVAQRRLEEFQPLSILQKRRALDAHRDVFSRASFHKGPGNTFVALPGGNGDTKLGVWISTDANGDIIDRTVIKDVCFDYDPNDWTNPITWQNVRDTLNKVLTEARVMERLRDTEDSQNVVRLRSRQLHAEELVFRVGSRHRTTVRVITNYVSDVYRVLSLR